MNLFPDARRGVSDRGRQASDAAFGERLRLERERRRITLASIAANTKIGLHLLEGLERGNVSRWPSGIFRKSFIRDYAAAIGLDADEVAREFLERFPDPAEKPRSDSSRAQPSEQRMPSGETALRLNLAEPGAAGPRGQLLASMRPRWAAVAWDVGTLLAIGLMLFVAFNHFWMPFAIATLAYYGASILLLGNTPGVSLFAPGAVRNGAGRAFASLASAFSSPVRPPNGRRDEVVNR